MTAFYGNAWLQLFMDIFFQYHTSTQCDKLYLSSDYFKLNYFKVSDNVFFPLSAHKYVYPIFIRPNFLEIHYYSNSESYLYFTNEGAHEVRQTPFKFSFPFWWFFLYWLAKYAEFVFHWCSQSFRRLRNLQAVAYRAPNHHPISK